MASKFSEAEFLKTISALPSVRPKDYVRQSWPKKRIVKAAAKPVGSVSESTDDFYTGLRELLSGFYPNNPSKVDAIIETFRQEYASSLCSLSREDVQDLENQFRIIA